MSFVADPKKPVGGHVLAHASTVRLYLRKGIYVLFSGYTLAIPLKQRISELAVHALLY